MRSLFFVTNVRETRPFTVGAKKWKEGKVFFYQAINNAQALRHGDVLFLEHMDAVRCVSLDEPSVYVGKSVEAQRLLVWCFMRR